MMMYVVWGLAIAGGLATLLVPKRAAITTGVISVFVLACFFPSFGPPSADQLAVTLISSAIVLLALIRVAEQLGTQRPHWFLILYIAYTSIAYTQNRSQNNSYLVLASGLLMLLLVVAATYASDKKLRVLTVVIPALIVFEFIAGFAEEVLHLNALWPRPNGEDRIASRVNYFATFLPGRALGSFASPLVYGSIAAIASFILIWMMVRTGQKRYAVLIPISLGCLVYSGSRSPVLILAIALALWAVSSLNLRNAYAYVLTAIIFVAGALSLNFSSLLGFDNFDETTSYVHRVGIFDSIANLLTLQDMNAVIFGNGAAASDLIGGIVGGVASVGVYDNQYVSELAKSGVIGLVLLLLVLADGFRRGNRFGRLMTLMVAMTIFTYDALTWRVIFIVAVIALTGPADPSARFLRSKSANPEMRPPVIQLPLHSTAGTMLVPTSTSKPRH